MKPLMLKICGWGPYPGENTIDFSSMQEGLFLISGSTGSGKTTIFDALTYALYGKVSGTVRTQEHLRSDFALPATETFVELTFIHRKKNYTIRRSPKYEREKKRGEGTTTKNEDATLLLENGDVISGAGKVNLQVLEILGIGYEQFTRISMLAQGEFQKVLLAKSARRTEIFRDIFHTEIYQNISERAKSKAKEIADTMKEVENRIRETASPEMGSEYMEAASRGDYEQMQKQIHGKVQHLQESLKENNGEIEALTRKREDLLVRQQQKQQVKLELEELNQKQQQLKMVQEDILKKQQDLRMDGEKLHEQRPDMEQDRERMVRLGDLKEKADQIDTLQKEQKACSKQELTCRHRLDCAILCEWEKQQQDAARLMGQYEEEKLVHDNILIDYEKLKNDYEKEKKIYEEMLSRLQDARAGLLAKELKDQEPCPVCGSMDHPRKAKLLKDVPKEQEIKQQKEKRDNVHEQYMNSYQKAVRQKEKAHTLFEKAIEATDTLSDRPSSGLIKQMGRCSCDTREEEEKRLTIIKQRLAEITAQLEILQKDFPKGQKAQNVLEAYEILEKKTNDYFDQVEQWEESSRAMQGQHLENTALLSELSDRKKKIMGTVPRENELEEISRSLNIAGSCLQDAKKAREEILNSLGVFRQSAHLVDRSLEEKKHLDRKYGIAGDVSNLLNGNNRLRLTFEQYVLISYFNDILKSANLRLREMTNGRYEMYRCEEIRDGRTKDQLDIDILDFYTGKRRSVKTLSGGELFQAALSLALGLSDVIQNYAGGMEVEMLFVDEGFGALDEEALLQAVDTLKDLSGSHRMIGMISHVAELQEQMERKILVKRNNYGSIIEKT